MNLVRFDAIALRYSRLRIAVVGDFCLDRYLEIDPVKGETSIETGLEVHNVVRVRSQPGAAGTILNNLVALGIGQITPVGFCGDDGEGYELIASLRKMSNVRLDHFLQTPERRTFTYCKPLVIEPGKPPRELNRLDSKNWSPTPESVRAKLRDSFHAVARESDAVIIMDQVDLPDTGVVTRDLLDSVREVAMKRPELLIIADSRRSLKGWPPVLLKMNRTELSALSGTPPASSVEQIKATAVELARHHGRPVFVTLAEQGIVGAEPGGAVHHQRAFPVRGDIDIVGAGDSVTANLAVSLAAGATVSEALELAMAGASLVIHQLGTTGTASVTQIRELLGARAMPRQGTALELQ
jgi:rfaE bifunctional protein kinase chain/domain